MNTDERRWSSLKSEVVIYLRLSAFIGGSILFLCGCRPKHPPVETPSAPTTQIARDYFDVSEAMALIDRRDDWTTYPPINIPRDPAEKFLKGVTIVIDPGHGGTDGGNISTRPAGYKAGRAGEKEANINMRVALLLERLLKDAEVNVILTRRGDETISLTERAEVANNAVRLDGGIGADLFISIHHNAGGSGANYTSVFFHGDIDNNEPDADLARHISFELGREMRTQVAKTSTIFSSFLMYNTGFGVLRACKVPAVLLECSFFTDREEERRLADPVYNLREAYGIYRGLCNWAYCGRPTQTVPVVARTSSDRLELTTTLSEGLPAWWGADRPRIVSSTVSLTVDGVRQPATFDPTTKTLTATLPRATSGPTRIITIHHTNFLKNSNWPQRYEIAADDDGDVRVRTLPAYRGAATGRRPTTAATTRVASP